MSDRPIKVRAWDKVFNKWIQLTAASTHGQDNRYLPTVLVAFGAKGEEVAIQQYTGLEDKNGVEIYEGDVISDGLFVFIVEWGQTGFVVSNADNDELWTFDDNGYEIIGNIYENPELLK